jgi:5'-nucleotidase
MSMMQYDLYDRNHDFDNGIQGLYAQMPHAKWICIC